MSGATASRADVARLFGRAGFGATPAELDTWAGQPYADAVEHLLDVPASPPPRPDDAERLRIQLSAQANNNDQALLSPAQRWWMERMRTTPFPLLERMTLLWHDHFATAFSAPHPDLAMMLVQNQLLRQHALGSFRDMVLAINVDPAMLYWLDGARSSRPVPNENYARELMELFTVGKYPQTYGEADVREAARMLTGWVVNLNTRQSQFQAARHDTGRKTVLGRTFNDAGAQEHVQLTDHLLAQPVTARFIAYKLVRALAYDPSIADVSRGGDSLVTKVAQALRRAWDIRAAVRTLLLSDEYRHADARAGRQLVRQPVHVIVAACRALGHQADAPALAVFPSDMGQRLLAPPNVGGWPTGTMWISPPTMLARYNFAVVLYNQATKRAVPPVLPAADDLTGWASFLGLPGLSATTERSLRVHLAESSKAKVPEPERQRSVLVLLLTSPDWMVL